MARKLSVLVFAALFVLVICSAGCWPFGRRDNTAREDQQKRLLAGIYGTWVSPDGHVIVLLADKGLMGMGNQLIGGIPGPVHGRIMIKEPVKDAKWKQGIYKVVDRRVLARSTTDETWALTLTCDLARGQLFLPSGSGKQVELHRSAMAPGVKEGDTGVDDLVP